VQNGPEPLYTFAPRPANAVLLSAFLSGGAKILAVTEAGLGRRTEEAETIGQDLDDAFTDNVGFLDRELFEDGEHQLLLAHGAGVFDCEAVGL
jgi:hypothetical protein